MNRPTPEFEAVIERLEKLEKQNSRIKRICLIISTFLVSFFILYPAFSQTSSEKTRDRKFLPYQSASNISRLELGLLKAEVGAHEVRFRDLGSIGVPTYSWDNSQNRIVANVFVSPRLLESNPLETVRKELESEAIAAVAPPQVTFPEGLVKVDDVIVYFNSFNKSADFYTVAVYRDGKLIMQ